MVQNVEKHLFYDTPPIVLVSFVILELISPGTSATFSGWPLLISLVLLGIPHGAIDLRLSGHLRHAVTWKQRVRAFGIYLLLLLWITALFVTLPAITLLGFLVVSGLHFGLADARDLAARFPNASSEGTLPLAALARGGLILALPFSVAAVQSLSVFDMVAQVAAGSSLPVDTTVVTQVATSFVGLAMFTQLIVTVRRIRDGQLSAATVELRESLAIVTAFLLLHPLFAIGLYLLVWHSWRHMFKLVAVFGLTPADGNARAWLGSIAKLHIYALPLTLPTLAIFGCLAWLRLESLSSGFLAAVAIVIFVVVTVPHHLLVEKLESREKRQVEPKPSQFTPATKVVVPSHARS